MLESDHGAPLGVHLLLRIRGLLIREAERVLWADQVVRLHVGQLLF